MRAIEVARLLEENVARVVRGKPREIRLVLTALACRGHVLFEDVPGTAKTVLTRALAASVDGAATARVQCTPDLQPTDVTGLSVFNQKTRDFEFRPGPVFANVLLVDEINRAMPKTQSSLLEAMAEQQVTVDGVTRALPDVFLLFATENPIEHEGTFPLPEAQLDRFFLQLELDYPEEGDELRIVQDQRHGHPLRDLRPVVSLDDVETLQRAVEEVYVDELIQRWLVALVRATRSLEIIELPASVRGSIALERAVRGWALLDGREYVEPEDVEALFGPVVGHRILLAPAFAATARRLGRREAMAQLWRRCLELAPPPERVAAAPV
ncbi:MAG TPA: AAA family ATPase [Gaiellaceae bacterium]|nr:AAA family ATPase [Gaiellaceae bacterium]